MPPSLTDAIKSERIKSNGGPLVLAREAINATTDGVKSYWPDVCQYLEDKYSIDDDQADSMLNDLVEEGGPIKEPVLGYLMVAE